MKTLRERAIPTMIKIPVPIPAPDGEAIADTKYLEVKAMKDPTTGEVYLDGDALAQIDRFKARLMGILLPDQIKALRDRFGMTQAEMSELLHIGAKTYTRWETGREPPSHSMNLFLKLLNEGRMSIADIHAACTPHFDWMTQAQPAANSDLNTTPISLEQENGWELDESLASAA